MGCEADLSIVGAPRHTDYEQGRFVLAQVVVGNRKIVPALIFVVYGPCWSTLGSGQKEGA